MSAWRRWHEEKTQVVMTRLVNRTFRQKRNVLDRCLVRLLARLEGPVHPDPDLEGQ